jgi:hypothetical protein
VRLGLFSREENPGGLDDDVTTLWRAFTQGLGVTPAEYRQRFAAD